MSRHKYAGLGGLPINRIEGIYDPTMMTEDGIYLFSEDEYAWFYKGGFFASIPKTVYNIIDEMEADIGILKKRCSCKAPTAITELNVPGLKHKTDPVLALNKVLVDEIVKLKNAGFSSQEIIELANAKVV